MEHPDAEVLEKRQQTYDDYQQKMTQLITRLTDAGKSVALIGPSIYDETAELDTANYSGSEHRYPSLYRTLAGAGLRACARVRRLQCADARSQPVYAGNGSVQYDCRWRPHPSRRGGPLPDGQCIPEGSGLPFHRCRSGRGCSPGIAQYGLGGGQEHPDGRRFAFLQVLPEGPAAASQCRLHPRGSGSGPDPGIQPRTDHRHRFGTGLLPAEHGRPGTDPTAPRNLPGA